jgi:CTP synthase
MKNVKKTVNIAVVGKYFTTGNFTLSDSYISVIEAVKHASWNCGAKAKMTWLDSEIYEKDPKKLIDLKKFDAVIVPGGFGTRGVEGIIKVIQYAREKNIPYLGLCYGMQLMSIEFARHVLKLKDANTVECNPQSANLIIGINPNQKMNVKNNRYGGTMRLGAYDCELKDGSRVLKLYGFKNISERHRHRYEFNNDYRKKIDEAGLKVVGINKESDLVEILELKNHPFFIGTQFHPEFKSRPLHPHPLFVGLIKAALKRLR